MTRSVCLHAVANFLVLYVMGFMQAPPSVEGRVYDSEGKPAADIIVDFESIDVPGGFHLETKTDDLGKFQLRGLIPGLYAVYPYNVSKGYQFTGNTFQSVSPARVLVPRDGPPVHRDLQLPAQAGTILLRFVSVDSHLPIKSAPVVLCHTLDVRRSAMVGTNADGELLYYVPANESISALIKAPGFPEFQTNNIVARSSEMKRLTIEVPPTVRPVQAGQKTITEPSSCLAPGASKTN